MHRAKGLFPRADITRPISKKMVISRPLAMEPILENLNLIRLIVLPSSSHQLRFFTFRLRPFTTKLRLCTVSLETE
jgi:hypothetical protein